MIEWTKDYPLPIWVNPLLQGTSFWMGYKTQLYRHYPLTEGAIVGEAVALLKGNLDSNFRLECERMYKELNVPIETKERADLVIMEDENIKTVIEVKRTKATDKKITNDLERLAVCNTHNPTTRCFLLLVSQGERPSNYIDNNGRAIGEEIISPNYVAKVRRACKAASSFDGVDSANYSCLIEVVSV